MSRRGSTSTILFIAACGCIYFSWVEFCFLFSFVVVVFFALQAHKVYRCDAQPRINQALNEQGDCLETFISIIGGAAIDTFNREEKENLALTKHLLSCGKILMIQDSEPGANNYLKFDKRLQQMFQSDAHRATKYKLSIKSYK